MISTLVATGRWRIDHTEYLNFAGSGYLALGDHPEVRGAAARAIAEGSAFSRQLPAGYGVANPYFDDVERATADFFGEEAAAFFASGFLIGLVLLAAHCRSADRVYVDDGAHYNLVTAARTREGFVRYPGGPDALRAAIRQTLRPGERPVVMLDGVQATTGALAPLSEIESVLESYEGIALVDDSHGAGAFGPSGRGVVGYLGATRSFSATTLSKAFGTQGAVIADATSVIDRARGQAPLRGANSGSPVSAASSAAALRVAADEAHRRTVLAERTSQLRSGLRALGLAIEESPAPIVSFGLDSRERLLAIQTELLRQKIFVLVSDYLGSGPNGMIRCALFADHTSDDVDALIRALESLL